MPRKTRPDSLPAYSRQEGLLDRTNLRLLTELQADPRITMSALARRAGMSAPAVTERVQRLERAGVIAGYRVIIDPAAVGLPVTAFARIRPAPGQLPKVAELAAGIPAVSECYRITGEDCFLVRLHAATVEQIETVLDRFLLYGQTTTSIVVSTPVPPRPLPLGQLDLPRISCPAHRDKLDVIMAEIRNKPVAGLTGSAGCGGWLR